MASIKLKNISKEFWKKSSDKKLNVLDNVSFEVKDGEFVTLFGPNGCGKTTLLYIIAGIEDPSSGEVFIGGRNPGLSSVGFVFQNYNESMLPWRTVEGNIRLGLEMLDLPESERKRITDDILKKAGLFERKDEYFYELSGGMKQLVAICRAFAFDPGILLMDEPFSSLDYSTSRKMGLELLEIWKEKKKTTLFVSHDIDEAIFLADRVMVLTKMPAKIKDVIEIDLPRPRKIDVISSKKFFMIRNKILGISNYEQ